MKTIIFMVFLTTIQPRIYIVIFCKIVSLTSSMLFCFYTFLTAHCLPWIGGGVVMVLLKYEKMMIWFCAKRQFSWGDQGNGIYSFLCCFRRIFTFPPNWRQLWSLILFASMQGNNNNMQGRALFLKCIFPQWLPNAHAFTTVSHHNFFEIQLLSFKLGYSYQATRFQGLDSPYVLY